MLNFIFSWSLTYGLKHYNDQTHYKFAIWIMYSSVSHLFVKHYNSTVLCFVQCFLIFSWSSNFFRLLCYTDGRKRKLCSTPLCSIIWPRHWRGLRSCGGGERCCTPYIKQGSNTMVVRHLCLFWWSTELYASLWPAFPWFTEGKIKAATCLHDRIIIRTWNCPWEPS